MLLAMPARHRYLLMRRLGRTGHSTVYAAIDQLLAREVALKLHHDERENDGEWRVLDEARTMSRVEHPNIVRVLDLGEHEGTFFAVTELCDADMTTWAGGKSWAEVVDRILEAGRGLAALHAAGYIHGDIKPGNILIRNGVAKLADFGLAAEAGRPASVGGTAGFIAPEVADGQRGEAGDVFALAATAWACLLGRPAFGVPPKTAERAVGIMILVERARAGEIEEPPSSSKVPRRVLAVVRRGLEPDPAKRPGLERWLSSLAAARPLSVRWRASGAPRLSSVALVACASLMLGAGGHALYQACRPTETEPAPAQELAPAPKTDFYSQMIDAAEHDDPFGVWALYWPTKEVATFDAEQLVAVATILLLDAESGAASNPGASAEIAKRLASDAWWIASTAGDHARVAEVRELVARAKAIINRNSRSSRPD
jgi:hypothetical protein